MAVKFRTYVNDTKIMEQFDVLDANGRLTGLSAIKGEPLKNGQYYLGVHVYIYNHAMEFLLQQRSYDKAFLPGGWDVLLEHVIAGESSKEAAIRGVKEEIGLTANENNVKFMGRIVWEEYHHIIDVYFLKADVDIDSLSLQNNEVIGAKFVSKNEIMKMVSAMMYRPESYRQFLLQEINELSNYEFKLANYDEISEITSIYHSLIGTPGCTWDLDYPNRETAEYDINNGFLYVLKDGKKIIAVASAGNFDELGDLQWKLKNPCELARIGVMPTMQKQGIGSILLKYIIKTMAKKGYDGMRFTVCKNNHSAIALYNKIGFEKCGEVYRFGRDNYCYQMQFNILFCAYLHK